MDEERFRLALLKLCEQQKSIVGWRHEKFRNAIEKHGALQTAKQLINGLHLSAGFRLLAEKGRLDLTVGSLIQGREWQALFSEEERHRAKKRLEDWALSPTGAESEQSS